MVTVTIKKELLELLLEVVPILQDSRSLGVVAAIKGRTLHFLQEMFLKVKTIIK